MSWVYAEVGVLRPEIDPGELRTLAADWGLTSAGYYEASAELPAPGSPRSTSWGSPQPPFRRPMVLQRILWRPRC